MCLGHTRVIVRNIISWKKNLLDTQTQWSLLISLLLSNIYKISAKQARLLCTQCYSVLDHRLKSTLGLPKPPSVPRNLLWGGLALKVGGNSWPPPKYRTKCVSHQFTEVCQLPNSSLAEASSFKTVAPAERIKGEEPPAGARKSTKILTAKLKTEWKEEERVFFLS